MKRDYSTGVKEQVNFFFGKEIEHTPAHGKNTFFVVGLHDPQKIYDILVGHNDSVEHIYFGANQSFDASGNVAWEHWEKWERMISFFLNKGYWCTLDVDVKDVEGLLEGGLCENHKFIPMISVKLPYLQQLGYNATIKLDDKDFNATNPGVWCHRLHDLLDTEKFTNWDQYKDDTTL